MQTPHRRPQSLTDAPIADLGLSHGVDQPPPRDPGAVHRTVAEWGWPSGIYADSDGTPVGDQPKGDGFLLHGPTDVLSEEDAARLREQLTPAPRRRTRRAG